MHSLTNQLEKAIPIAAGKEEYTPVTTIDCEEAAKTTP